MRLSIVLLALSMGFCGVAFAAKTYKYRCVKCGLIQEYSTPGVRKCPNDGRPMIRVD